jgi:hypothetical protein
MTTAGILWRRLDTPGHDACRLDRVDAGWQLDGTAVFLHEGLPARLGYNLTCDLSWRTQRGHVQGWLGSQSIAFTITRTPEGAWTLNGAAVQGLHECVDLDLGFTPATNLFQLRRLALADAQAADVPVAWLDVAAGTLDLLHQRYERRSQTTYRYEAPRFGYAATLEVSPMGFVHKYPGLWEAESFTDTDKGGPRG